MKVTFVLPGPGHQPTGGFKVVYEYANGLATRGHEVSVVHAPFGRLGQRSLKHRLRRGVNYSLRRLGALGGYRPDSWFKSHRDVQVLWIPSLHPRWIPTAQAVVATSWETAEWVAAFPRSSGRKFYLLQHFENIFRDADASRVLATWKAPLHKIVIARWLLEKAKEMGETADYIPNGLNFQDFYLHHPIAERAPQSVLMLYHLEPWKGSEDGLQAILQAKRKIPDLQATLFSIFPRPKSLPDWISYYHKPHQEMLRQLYNQATVFLAPSLSEGWPLPPAEAAQCGAALCLTDIGGHREYAQHESTALLSPPGKPDLIADHLIRLLTYPELRIKIAENAHQFIQQFTWDRAVNSLIQVLNKSDLSPIDLRELK